MLERIHALEHELLPEAIRLLARGASGSIRTTRAASSWTPSSRYPRARMPDGTETVHEDAPTAPGEVEVRRALLSVSDKTGIVEFARGLADLGIEIVSTGGTAGALADAGIPHRSITRLHRLSRDHGRARQDAAPEALRGPAGGARRARRTSRAAADAEVELVDLVCVNLYPFEQTVAQARRGRRRGDREHRHRRTNDDPRGGEELRLRGAVVSPESYDAMLEELRDGDGRLSLATRESLAAEAFAYTARYDTAIARWFSEKRDDFPPLFVRAFEKVTDLSYGENPHQRAAYYAQVGSPTHLLSNVRQLGGKQLSFNNLLDLNAARLLVHEFGGPACVIVKHNNPCGVALGDTALDAYGRAFAGDPQSAFGGVVCLNRAVDGELAEALVQQFVEVLFAPGYDEAAIATLASKPNLRMLQDDEEQRAAPGRAGGQAGRRRTAAPGPRPRHAGARRDEGRDGARGRRSPNGASWCSRGASASTCGPTRSCWRATAPRSASARGR